MNLRFKKNRKTIHESYERQKSRFDISYYDEMKKVDYHVAGKDGYKLHIQYLRNPKPTDRFIIISHGYTDNHMGALKYVKMYLDFGFNCIIYDLRGHGENRDTTTTFGVFESIDLSGIIRDTRRRFKNLKVLGLHGESLGASTSLYTLGRQDLDFVVADCGFKALRDVMKESVHLKSWQIAIISFGYLLKYHITVRQMSPIRQLKENRVPVLFIHGAEDEFIFPHHARDMYRVTRGVRRLHIIPKADHAHSIIVAPELYRKYVRTFFKKIEIV